MLLRGPQTPGELRAHGHRLHPFGSLEEVQSALDGLASRTERPLVVRLPRAPGAREARWSHLLGDDAEAVTAAAMAGETLPAGGAGGPAAGLPSADEARTLLAALETRLAQLEARVTALETALNATGMPGPH